MNLVSKFNLGDRVWRLDIRDRVEAETCPQCAGTGSIKSYDLKYTYTCRAHDCNRGKVNVRVFDAATPAPMTIGQVTIVERDRDRADQWHKQREETYMCKETGVGSGSVWDVDKLYASDEEANAAAAGITRARALDEAYAHNERLDIVRKAKATRMARIEAGAIHDDECEGGNEGLDWPINKNNHDECECLDRLLEKEGTTDAV